MRYLLTLLITIVFLSTSAAQLISFSPFKISFSGRGNKPTVWCYQLKGTAPCGYYIDSVKQNKGKCATGYSTTKPIVPRYAETCNGVDDNCNGQIDEGLAMVTYWLDTDGDSYGDPNNSIVACLQPALTVQNSSDCNDLDATIHLPKPYYKDGNNDGYGDDSALVFLCSNTAPIGYTTNPPVTAQITLTNTNYVIGVRLKGISAEAGIYDKKNFVIDILSPNFTAHTKELGSDLTISYGGSSISHSNTFIDGDTIVSGIGQKGNGYNGQFILWGGTYATSTRWTPPLPLQKQGYLNKTYILDGANWIDWGESFNPLIVTFCKNNNTALQLIYNANQNDLPTFLNFTRWVKSKNVTLSSVSIGAELSGRNYSNAGDFPDGSTSYVKNVVTTLCDSLTRLNPTLITSAWVAQKSDGNPDKWNNAITTCNANTVTVYILGTYLGAINAEWSYPQRLDSIQKWFGQPLYNWFDFYRNLGKQASIHQWIPNYPENDKTFLETNSVSIMFHGILNYDYAHLNFIVQCFYNGWKNTGMNNTQATNTFYALKNCFTLLQKGAVRYDVTALHDIEGDATLVGDEYRVHIWNNTGTPQSITAISIDKKIYKTFTASGFIVANSLDDTFLRFQDITDGQFPAYFDGVLTVKK